jgi:uncharacterized phosphosugar-binding protein
MNAYKRYFTLLRDNLDRIQQTQEAAAEQAAARIAACVLAGGTLFTFGTGHGHLLALEIFYRAGGLAGICPILDENLMLHISASGSTDWERKEGLAQTLLARYAVKAGDVLLCISNSGRNAAPVEMARAFQSLGGTVIALTNLAHSRASSPRAACGLRLFEVADLVIDNCGVPGDAVWRDARGRMVGPTSTAVGAAILQGVVCRVNELCEEAGAGADFFVSSNIDGGDEINAKLIETYRRRISIL